MAEGEHILEANEFTVSASEKVSTGDYETANFHASIEGEVNVDGIDESGVEEAVLNQLKIVQQDLQEIVRREAEARRL